MVVTVGTIKEWHNADRQGYYSAGYYDVPAKVFKCSKCGRRIGETKLLASNYCPNCGAKFEDTMSDAFVENCNKLIGLLKKEKKKIDKKINSINYKDYEVQLHNIDYYLERIPLAIKDWSQGKYTSDYDKYNKMYHDMVNM